MSNRRKCTAVSTTDDGELKSEQDEVELTVKSSIKQKNIEEIQNRITSPLFI